MSTFCGTGFSREGDFMRTVNFAESVMPSSRLKPVPQWITAADVPALRGQARSYTGSAPYALSPPTHGLQAAGFASKPAPTVIMSAGRNRYRARPASSKQVGRATPTSSQAKTTCRSALVREPRWVRQTRVATTTRRNAGCERGFCGTGFSREGNLMRTVNVAESTMPSSRLKPVPQWITAADVPAPSRASALLHRVCAVRALGG